MHKSNSSKKTWYPLKEYPLYEINKDGQIRNAKTGKIRKIDYSNSHYARIILRTPNGNVNCVHVDELVANTFLTNTDPDRFDTLKHIDGDPYNCSANNLTWTEYDRFQHHPILKNDIVKPKEYYSFYPLLEFPDSIYEINKMGQVRNKKTRKLLKGAIRTGYLTYTLLINKKVYFRSAHIMVAKQFIPNPENKPIVNHIDENKANPCIDNLEWVTPSENSIHGEAQKRANIARNKPVNEYSLQGEYIRTWRSSTLIADSLAKAHSVPANQLRNYIRKVVNLNSRNDTIKRPFCNRIFMKYNGDCENVDIIVSKQKPRKYKKLNLDNIEIPEGSLISQNEIKTDYIETLKSLKTANTGLSYHQRQAIDYAIECIMKVEKKRKVTNKRS